MKSFALDCLQRSCCALITLTVMLAGADQLHSQQQWLVLKNGENLHGQVSLNGDSYSVLTDSGSRIVIPDTQARFVADSIQEIYWDKWSRVDPSDPQRRRELFRWCLKHGLFQEAQQQIELLAKAEHVESQSEHLAGLASELELALNRRQREIELARQQAARQQAKEPIPTRRLPPLPGSARESETIQAELPQLASAPTIPSIPIDSEGRPVQRLPAKTFATPARSEVMLVDFEEELSEESAESLLLRREKPAWVSNRKLDQEVRQMPKGTVSFYKRHIEPHLVSNCIGCHDSCSQAMPLSKRSIGQTIPRRMSQQNLHFVMQQVDRQKPFESPLYAMAMTAHGDQQSAAFSEGDAFLFELRKWTVAVSEDPAQWLMQLSEESQTQPEPATVTEPKSGDAAAGGFIVTESRSQDTEASSADPYDPSAFNGGGSTSP